MLTLNTKARKAAFDFSVSFAVVFVGLLPIDRIPRGSELGFALYVATLTTVAQYARRYKAGE